MLWTDPLLIPLWLGKWVLYRFASTLLLLDLARFRGSLDYRLKHKRRQIRRQLAAYYGDSRTSDQIDRLCEQNLQYLQELRIARIWPQRRDFDALAFEVEGREHLDAALAGGRGAILLTVHFGYGRLIKHLMARLGCEAEVVGNMADRDAIEGWTRFRYFVHTRLLGLPFFRAVEDNDLPTGINIRPIMRALQLNRPVVMAADGRDATGFATSIILNKQRQFATGSVNIAAATGTPLIPSFVVDTGRGARHMKLLFKAPLPIEAEKSVSRVGDAFLAFGRVVEAVINDYPHLQDWKRLRYWPAVGAAPRQRRSRAGEKRDKAPAGTGG